MLFRSEGGRILADGPKAAVLAALSGQKPPTPQPPAVPQAGPMPAQPMQPQQPAEGPMSRHFQPVGA